MCNFFCSLDPFALCCCCLPFGPRGKELEDDDETSTKDMPVRTIPASRDQFVRASNNSRESYLRDYE